VLAIASTRTTACRMHHGRIHTRLSLLLALGVGALAPAQTRPNQSGEARTGDPQRTSIDTHSERASRELFRGCDADSDDRLDLFEATDALETLDDPKDSRSFLLLDGDRDGYLTWTEFDAHFHAIVQRGAVFRVRTCRQQVAVAPELQPAAPATPTQRFLQLHDKNQNGGLDPEEVDRIVQQAGLLPAIGGQLKQLDIDRSGRIEEAELAPWFDQPWFQQLGARMVMPGIEPAAPPSPLPPPWTAIDASGDGRVDLDELTRALRRLDPGLARWAKHLLQQVDRDGDGAASAAELPSATPAGAAATAKAGTKT
jgi:Ca2+-binding EF-hand superfamily protein